MKILHTNVCRFTAAVFTLLYLSSGGVCAQNYSTSILGFKGLNTVPSARMAEAGEVRAGVSYDDPYMHGYFGMQIVEPLYIGLRQTAEGSNPFESADRLYPGIDLKFRALKETHSLPAIAIGLQSAAGHKRMAGEFITASKRWHDFDFTFGAGWGRFAGKGHLDNPLKGLFSHFGKARPIDGELPNGPADWFTGERIGLFGGVEYFTPVEGLSIKADVNSDRYEAERLGIAGYDTHAPWAVGVNYKPPSWHGMAADLSAALHGTDRVMARLNLSGNLKDWRDYDARSAAKNYKPLYPRRTSFQKPGGAEVDAMREGINLYHARINAPQSQAYIALNPYRPITQQIGRGALHMANNGGADVETLGLRPTVMGLRGPRINLSRASLERAAAHHNGSGEEIWHAADFDTSGTWSMADGKLRRPMESQKHHRKFSLVLDNVLSLSEENRGVFYRTSLIGGYEGAQLFGLIDFGTALRLKVTDNLDRFHDFRPIAILPIRSNIDDFVDRFIALDRAWGTFTHSFKTDLHIALTAGYLEEMYAGAGGEILYRPFKSRFAVGAEVFQAFKRDPSSVLNLELTGDTVSTGHVNFWYDVPHIDATAQVKFGRYLAGDIGGTLSLEKTFNNGVQLEAFAGMSNLTDVDIFGGTTHLYNGLRLTLPLNGCMPRVIDAAGDARIHTAARFALGPMGRDSTQAIDKPVDLYDLATPFSYRHIADHWWRVTD